MLGRLRERDHMEDLGVDYIIVLKNTLGKECERDSSGLVWTGGELL